METVVGGVPEDVRAAKVTCRDSRLDDVFIAFMDDVTSQLDKQNAVEVLVSSAAAWRNLLRVVSHGLSDSAAAGLYGELRFLEELIHSGGPKLIETWQIDGHDVHDFIADRIRVEVKTSSFQNRQAVTIHGLKQLEVPATARLVLAVAEIEKHGDGETIDDVVDRVLEVGAPIDVLSQKLEAGGFVRGMSSFESAPTFSLKSWRYWEMTPDSPVLSTQKVGPDVSTAISDVQYSLNLSSLAGGESEFDWSLFQPEADHRS
ncbi:PD-(D/E)XK motif protein [Brevibacterium yomogidense]|uniref:PD-(D/E)XK motif protein n=1 Tax=Brevibacterium yomogidense TaxID=946573 RepID=UPI0018DFA5F6